MKLLIRAFITCVVTLLAQVAISDDTWATNWAVNPPQSISRAMLSNATPQSMYSCGESEATITIEGIGTVHRACVFGDTSTIRFARYGDAYAVAFPLSSRFYELRNPCAIPKCAYSPENDAFLTHQGRGPYGDLSVVLYKNFSKQLKRHFDFGSMRNYFQFEPIGEPDYILKMGDILPRGESVAFSLNGKYAVIEMRSYGFVRLNVDTLEERRVIAPGATYGLHGDPYHELAISNDGTKVALTGYRAQTAVYSIDSYCGDTLTSDTQTYLAYGSIACEPFYFSEVTAAPGFYHSFNPQFNGDGSRLGMSVYWWSGTVERIVFGSLGTNAPIDYIALGDSFVSGEGEVNDSYYVASRRGGDSRCHASVRAYPYLLGQEWGVETQSVACSGARTSDITNLRNDYYGQSGILRDTPDVQREGVKETALGKFQSGILPQVSFVSEYQPSLVSIGVGGNDAGLMTKLAACLNIDNCEWVRDPGKKLATANEISAVYAPVREVIAATKRASPDVNIVVVGYPQILNDSPGESCGVVISTLLNNQERAFITESIKLLNSVVRAAAYAEGIAFIDVEDAFDGNKLCDTTATPAMNGIRLGDDIAPISFIENFRVIGAESFHPTPKGHELVARAVSAAVGSVDAVTGCGVCSPAVIPPLSDYWRIHTTELGEGDIARQIQDTFLDQEVYIRGSELSVATDSWRFEAQSTVVIELHSEQTQLSHATATADGAVSSKVRVPESSPSGYHTVHLIGVAPDGKKVDIYESIAIVDNKTTDLIAVKKTNEYTANPYAAVDTENLVGLLDQGPFASNARVLGMDSTSGDIARPIPVSTGRGFDGGSSNSQSLLVWLLALMCVVPVVVTYWLVSIKMKQSSRERGG